MEKKFRKITVALAMAAAFLTARTVSSHAEGIAVEGSPFQTPPIQAEEQLQEQQYENITPNGAIQQGWINQDGNWYYRTSDGMIYTGWLNEEGNRYYFNLDGRMHTGWLNENGSWYYFNPDGKMRIGWLSNNGNWYYLDSEGKMLIGWLNENENWYYFDFEGKMLVGWLDQNGVRYYFNPNGEMQTNWYNKEGTWYYFNPDGALHTGWLQDKENWYYLNEDGAMVTGWLNPEGIWYYFNPDGSRATGWIKTDESWYYLNVDGSRAVGWLNLNNVWYYLAEDGKMATDTWIESSYVDSNGIWIENPEKVVAENEALNSADAITQNEASNATNTVVQNETPNPADAVVENEILTETTPVELETESTIGDDSSEYIKESIENLKEKYPDKMYWNHMGHVRDTATSHKHMSYAERQVYTNYFSEVVTSTPCNHSLYGTEYCNSYLNYGLGYVIGMQCDGFARKLSDEVFGTEAPRIDYSYSFEAVKVGDYIRYNNTHTVFVTAKDENSIQVAECNIGGTCMIRWGRKITREDLDHYSDLSCFTRY